MHQVNVFVAPFVARKSDAGHWNYLRFCGRLAFFATVPFRLGADAFAPRAAGALAALAVDAFAERAAGTRFATARLAEGLAADTAFRRTVFTGAAAFSGVVFRLVVPEVFAGTGRGATLRLGAGS